MQHPPRIRTLLVGFPTPGSVARRPARRPERSSRNAMADRPQDFDGGLGPAVRTVQHLNLQADDQTFAEAAPLVTLRNFGKQQCSTTTPTAR